MNTKNIVRLNENQLHNIIKKCINEALNEIGDTKRGQFMLGRLSSKKNRGDDIDRRIGYNAYKTAAPNGGVPSDEFQSGEAFQNSIDNSTDLNKKGDTYRRMKFQHDVYKTNDMDKLGSKFINFIEQYKGGVLLQTVVDFESGNQTGTPCSPLSELIPEFEDNVLGYECTPSMKNAIKRAYNEWWYYASDQLLSDEQ